MVVQIGAIAKRESWSAGTDAFDPAREGAWCPKCAKILEDASAADHEMAGNMLTTKGGFFTQDHSPAKTLSLDFIHMDDLGITIQGSPNPHLLCQVVLPYSNWKWARIVHGETLEGLGAGLLEGLLRLKGFPERLLTDNLTAAVRSIGGRHTFQARYLKLLEGIGLRPVHTAPRSHEQNGDNEREHGLLKAVRFIQLCDQSELPGQKVWFPG